ncbi:hypothetical protein BO94DRAFT_536351 [Aspergillus sclerotioniger CBS 115572]|uniref:Uncharacterized protein n=1 Tax=Aspergillus sclerotioniger CBS 115572 TaxID=1450535 RepID=A0A317WAW7_9EURO|nr:hypothetical protein BO94DRAFT_536351 [Aspergillus sclerotioniger CBS 115572]PWY83656.1 hypothetical protein BO94DRAFT_536351 [Aspergillus sclerotioniger CBS 115572]
MHIQQTTQTTAPIKDIKSTPSSDHTKSQKHNNRPIQHHHHHHRLLSFITPHLQPII